MTEAFLEGLSVAILATHGVEESELAEPRKELEKHGARTVLISPKAGKIQAMKHHDTAGEFDVDLTLQEAIPEDFDALLLPGGALNADALRMESKAQDFVRRMDAAGKPIAVICHGPWLLVSAGLAAGRTLTSYHTIRDDLQHAGARWVDQEVVRDDNWVSSRKPSDLPAFNREMIQLFAEQQQTGKIRKVS